MWEEDVSWSRSILLDGKCESDQLKISARDPTSPLSSTGNGSPYSGGSMSPDTTSISSPVGTAEGSSVWGGSENGDCFSQADSFTSTGFFFGCVGGSLSPAWCSSPGGKLPALHEWRMFDLQKKYLEQQKQRQHFIQRFIFPEVSPVLADEGGGHCPRDDSVVTSSTPSSPIPQMKRQSSNGGTRGSSSSTKLLPPPLTTDQRAVRFMKSFKSTSSAMSSVNKTLASEVISSSCVAEGGKPFDCMWIDCRASFLQKDSLIEHIDRTHIQTRREDFSCFWHGCVRRYRPFNARYKLLIHMRVHTGHKPNKCTESGCDKAFSRLENLKIHLRSHTGERPYICPHCPKAFSNSSDRAKHQRTHFDSKPYACTYQDCIKRYTDPSSLRKHAKMHFSCSGGGVGVKGTSKVGGASSGKKEGQHGKRNRRKYLGVGGDSNEIKTSVVPSLSSPKLPPPQPVFDLKKESLTGNASVHAFLNGNGDPQLNQLVSLSSPPLSSSSPHGTNFTDLQSISSQLIVQNEFKVEGSSEECSGIAASSSDLDEIPLGELDWISGVNFDDNFDIDYFL